MEVTKGITLENITLENIYQMSEIITGWILRSEITEIKNRDQAYILACVIVRGICGLEKGEAAKDRPQPLRVVTHRLKKGTVEELDRLVDEGGYHSRSDVIRKMVESGIEKLSGS